MGPIRQKKPKLQITNIDNICSVQRQIWKLFSKLKKIDKLKLHKKNLMIPIYFAADHNFPYFVVDPAIEGDLITV